VENMEVQLTEGIEEESTGRSSEIEVLEPSVSHKSHTGFRLVPKSITLDDLEQPKRSRKKTFYGARQKNLNDDRPILLVANCKPMVLEI